MAHPMQAILTHLCSLAASLLLWGTYSIALRESWAEAYAFPYVTVLLVTKLKLCHWWAVRSSTHVYSNIQHEKSLLHLSSNKGALISEYTLLGEGGAVRRHCHCALNR